MMTVGTSVLSAIGDYPRLPVKRAPRDAAAGIVVAWLCSIGELEVIAAKGWRAPEEERLGRWLLRAAQGFHQPG